MAVTAASVTVGAEWDEHSDRVESPNQVPEWERRRAILLSFRLVPDRCAVLIEARSTVGPISFGTVDISGTIRAAVADRVVRADTSPQAYQTHD